MSVDTIQLIDQTHSDSITKLLQSIQTDRLKMLDQDLYEFKVEFSDENLISNCKETLKTLCPNVIQHEDIVTRLTEGLSKDILQTEVSHPTKPQTAPTPPIALNPLESRHDF